MTSASVTVPVLRPALQAIVGALAWKRTAVAGTLALLLAAVLNPVFFVPFWVLLGRIEFVAAFLLIIFAAAGTWHPLRIPRWLAQVLAVVIAVPIATLLAYLPSIDGNLANMLSHSARISGFIYITTTVLVIAPILALGALYRERDAHARAAQHGFGLERSTLEREALDPKIAPSPAGRRTDMTDAPKRRRLLAILAADAAGYSRLMSVDDAAALASLDAAREVFREQIETRGGRVVDMAGDSVLAVFDTVASAVNAALAVQPQLAALTGAACRSQRMHFRIGVHLGDVLEKADGTVYGDGVNVASRLQMLGEPGGIIVSDAVRGSVVNRVDARFDYMGERPMKNIAQPVRAFRVLPSANEVELQRQQPCPRRNS